MLPIVLIILRHSAVMSAAVPETPVNKYNHPVVWKDKIRIARQTPVSTPAFDSVFT
jgi:hypothetical protein